MCIELFCPNFFIKMFFYVISDMSVFDLENVVLTVKMTISHSHGFVLELNIFFIYCDSYFRQSSGA